MLLVWLFGMVMGVANACALGEQAHHAATAADSHESHDGHDGHDGQRHHHGNEHGDPAKVNCVDFCEKSAIGVLQLKMVGDGLDSLAFALPSPVTLSLASLAESTVRRLAVDSRHLPGGPPPRIAYQRLAL